MLNKTLSDKLKDLVEEVGFKNKKTARILNLLIQIIEELLTDDEQG